MRALLSPGFNWYLIGPSGSDCLWVWSRTWTSYESVSVLCISIRWLSRVCPAMRYERASMRCLLLVTSMDHRWPVSIHVIRNFSLIIKKRTWWMCEWRHAPANGDFSKPSDGQSTQQQSFSPWSVHTGSWCCSACGCCSPDSSACCCNPAPGRWASAWTAHLQTQSKKKTDCLHVVEAAPSLNTSITNFF